MIGLLARLTSYNPNLQELALTLLRIGTGCIFLRHGIPKIVGGPEKWLGLGNAMTNLGITFAPVFWGFCAALSESLGGLMLVIGLGTRVAALFMSCVMIVALVMHISKGDGWAKIAHPLSLLVVFITLMIAGSGRHSLDYWFFQ